MNHNGKPINRPDFSAPPKDGKDHPVYESGQRERPQPLAERPQPNIRPYTDKAKRDKYFKAMRERMIAEGTWPKGLDEIVERGK